MDFRLADTGCGDSCDTEKAEVPSQQDQEGEEQGLCSRRKVFIEGTWV